MVRRGRQQVVEAGEWKKTRIPEQTREGSRVIAEVFELSGARERTRPSLLTACIRSFKRVRVKMF